MGTTKLDWYLCYYSGMKGVKMFGLKPSRLVSLYESREAAEKGYSTMELNTGGDVQIVLITNDVVKVEKFKRGEIQ